MIVSVFVAVFVIHSSFSTSIPEIKSYSKVSHNDQRSSQPQTPPPWLIRYSEKGGDPRLRSSLLSIKKQAQERFTPPAKIRGNGAQTYDVKKLNPEVSFISPSISKPISEPDSGIVFSQPFDFPPSDFESGDKFMTKPPSKIKTNHYSTLGDDSKITDLYHDDQEHDELPNSEFLNDPMNEEKPPKIVGYEGQLENYQENPYSNDYEITYDHDDFYHEHHDKHPSPEKPESQDTRLSKRPYSYYYIGRKLWYIPLYFSIYFIIYVSALVLKSIARHKINFPNNLADAAGDGRFFNNFS